VARTPAAEPEATLRIAAVSTEESPRVLRSFLFAEGLLAFDWQGRLTARVATDWVWEHEGRVLRMHLRPDVRFHDNTPVTAPVAVEIIRQQIPKPTTRGFEAVERVEAVDDRTIVFHLTRPDGFLPGALANLSIVDDRKPTIGTGPFKLVPNTPRLEAVRNDSYYRGRPGIARIRVIPYPTARASWAGLMRGDADMALEINKESVEFVPGFTINSSMQPFYIPLVFNIRNPILSRVEVRRAIAEAIDRDEIATNGMRGRGVVADADDPVWPAHWAYNAAAPGHTFNPNAARERLDTAGLPLRAASPGRRASRFQLNCIFYNEDPHFERIALLLQRQLAAVGVDLALEGLKGKELARRIAAGQFETYLYQLTSGRDVSWTYRFWHSPNRAMGPAMQNTGYTGADAALDQLRQALIEDDIRVIRVAVGDLRQRFYEDVPAVFLAWTQTTRAVDSRFDIGNPNDPEIFANLWRWRLAPIQTAAR
jgi:peptide/nickel transport system substrate-binding protein